MTENLLNPFNCTVPYLREIPGVPKDIKICDPATIIKNYDNIIQETSSQTCIPGCTRWEHEFLFTPTAALDPFYTHEYNFEASFRGLQYEHVKEVSVGCEVW